MMRKWKMIKVMKFIIFSSSIDLSMKKESLNSPRSVSIVCRAVCPARLDCVRCSRWIHRDSMASRPWDIFDRRKGIACQIHVAPSDTSLGGRSFLLASSVLLSPPVGYGWILSFSSSLFHSPTSRSSCSRLKNEWANKNKCNGNFQDMSERREREKGRRCEKEQKRTPTTSHDECDDVDDSVDKRKYNFKLEKYLLLCLTGAISKLSLTSWNESSSLTNYTRRLWLLFDIFRSGLGPAPKINVFSRLTNNLMTTQIKLKSAQSPETQSFSSILLSSYTLFSFSAKSFSINQPNNNKESKQENRITIVTGSNSIYRHTTNYSTPSSKFAVHKIPSSPACCVCAGGKQAMIMRYDSLSP